MKGRADMILPKCKAILLGILLVGLLYGCAGQNQRAQTTSSEATLGEIKRALQDAQTASVTEDSSEVPSVPENVQQALLPSYSYASGTGMGDPEHERFDIAVNRMLARMFFMGLVKGTPINITVHPEVEGRITLDLKNVTVGEVLEVTRDIYGYEYEKNRAGYLIMPSRLQSKIFPVNYLNVLRQGESNTRVTSGQIGNSETGRGGGAQNQGSPQTGGSSARAFASSKIETKSEADFWNDLQQTVMTIIGSGEGRSVVVSPQAGLVVVRAMTSELRDVERFLDAAQLSMHRQVILEAKIIEVQLNEHHQTGVNWAALDAKTSRTAVAGQLQLFDGASELVGPNGELLRGGLLGTQNLPGFGNVFAIGSASEDFATIIRLLNKQGSVNVLSSPRVSTVNNQKAVIKVGSDEFFVTEVSSTTVTGTATATTPQITLTPFFSGIALDVTPQIDENNEVILHVHPTISEVKDQTKDITVAGETQSLPLAFSTVRESDSIVRAKNGQVIVIGGLMQDQSTDNNSGVPGLRRVPILGHLFKQKQKITSRIELVILLKPIVVDTGNVAWNEDLKNVSGRVQGLAR